MSQYEEVQVNDSAAVQEPAGSVAQLKTNRGMIKYVLLNIITLGIYGLVVMSHVSNDINTVCAKDGKKTMHYFLAFLLGIPTCGIAMLVWHHKACSRVGAELVKRNIDYKFGAGTFWGWGIFGILLITIGRFIFIHKFLFSVDLINQDYNTYG